MIKETAYMVMWFFILLSCNTKSKKDTTDYFYTDVGWSYKRIPLIKPYEVKKLSENEWTIELQTTNLLEISIHDVKSVNIVDSVVIVYSKGLVPVKSEKYAEAWFVIIPKKQIEEAFLNQRDLVIYLEKMNIKLPLLLDADEVYNVFSKTNKLEWN